MVVLDGAHRHTSLRRHAIHQRNQAASPARAEPNAFIQPAMARPISSGESSWTKWTPAIATSVWAGHERAVSRFAPLVTSAPGSAFRNSLGTSLVANQSA